MGNFHCVPSGCAEVVYQEYLPPKIRWQYPNEPWQEKDGDNYLVQQPKGQCVTTYDVTVKAKLVKCYQNQVFYDAQTTRRITGKIIGVDLRNIGSTGALLVDYKNANNVNSTSIHLSTTRKVKETSCLTNNAFPSSTNTPDDINKVASTYEITNIVRVDGLPDNCGDCTFIITKNGAIVYQETRSVCPEVEKIPCRLSNVTKRIEIEKLPYLERVEVVPYQYSAYRLPGVPAPIPQADPIPSECLNVYNNAIYVIPPNPNALRNPNATPFDSFVAQICSAPGCLPPEYQVLCDGCGCTSCPPNTRPITCGNAVCCYDELGKAVLEIPIDNYCGGDSCG